MGAAAQTVSKCDAYRTPREDKGKKGTSVRRMRRLASSKPLPSADRGQEEKTEDGSPYGRPHLRCARWPA